MKEEPRGMKGDRVSIRDMAEELGLSTATVSNVLHGKTEKISAETVRRVQELVERDSVINRAGCGAGTGKVE